MTAGFFFAMVSFMCHSHLCRAGITGAISKARESRSAMHHFKNSFGCEKRALELEVINFFVPCNLEV